MRQLARPIVENYNCILTTSNKFRTLLGNWNSLCGYERDKATRKKVNIPKNKTKSYLIIALHNKHVQQLFLST